MNILIIEDEALAARQLQGLIRAYDPAANLLGTLDSVEGAVAWFTHHPTPDLLFADIELVDGQSFEVFERVQVRCPVIFTTAYDEFALRAFRVNSAGGRSLVVDYTLDELAQRLNPRQFFRANRQFILHAKAVDRVHLHFNGRLKLELKPAVSEEVFISRERAGEFRAWMGE